MSNETHDDCGVIDCPWPECGKPWGDLWDYHWSSRSEIETECPHCGRPILLSRQESVDYAARVSK